MISRVPSSRCEIASERIASSVTAPPALRITWASPSLRPRRPAGSSRASMQATMATPLAGGMGRSPLSNEAAYSSALVRRSIGGGHGASPFLGLDPNRSLAGVPPAAVGRDIRRRRPVWGRIDRPTATPRSLRDGRHQDPAARERHAALLVQHRSPTRRTPPQPPLHPGTGQPIGPDDLAPLFPIDLILQEVSTDREIADPRGGARRAAAVAADAALPRAPARARAGHPLAHLLQVRGRLAGRLAQAEHGRRRRRSTTPRPAARRIATETGAGQWGSSMALACQFFGLECKVYMVRVSYDQKPYRRMMMETWGAEVVPSPSPDTNAGRGMLEQRPRLARQPRHRHLRGGRGRRHARRHELRAGLGAEPRAAAPDRDRPGGAAAARAGRRDAASTW